MQKKTQICSSSFTHTATLESCYLPKQSIITPLSFLYIIALYAGTDCHSSEVMVQTVVRKVLHWLKCEMIGIVGMVAGTVECMAG